MKKKNKLYVFALVCWWTSLAALPVGAIFPDASKYIFALFFILFMTIAFISGIGSYLADNKPFPKYPRRGDAFDTCLTVCGGLMLAGFIGFFAVTAFSKGSPVQLDGGWYLMSEGKLTEISKSTYSFYRTAGSLCVSLAMCALMSAAVRYERRKQYFREDK